MPSSDARRRIVKAKLAVKQARKANALALDAGKPARYDDSAMAEKMTAVDDAARKGSSRRLGHFRPRRPERRATGVARHLLSADGTR